MNNPKTHDYTIRTWGHDFSISKGLDSGNTLVVMGWGRGIKKNDYLILPHYGDTTRYQVAAIEYQRDPSDMWKATLKFAPRK